MNDLREKFMPRFTALASERLRRGFLVASEGRVKESLAVAGDLHAMAGEAGLLGLPKVLEAARRAEVLATKLHETRGEEDVRALGDALRELEDALTKLETSGSEG